ncbi:Elongation of fatty acids protein 2 [Nowakowskiella sp. JEL0407]|nr:Elongation of fatty acids protein 2 [Nowakowskiella sp. JEL0407]
MSVKPLSTARGKISNHVSRSKMGLEMSRLHNLKISANGGSSIKKEQNHTTQSERIRILLGKMKDLCKLPKHVFDPNEAKVVSKFLSKIHLRLTEAENRVDNLLDPASFEAYLIFKRKKFLKYVDKTNKQNIVQSLKLFDEELKVLPFTFHQKTNFVLGAPRPSFKRECSTQKNSFVEKMNKNLKRLTESELDRCTDMLESLNVPYFVNKDLPIEAEALCAAICSAGFADAIATRDSDTLIFTDYPVLINLPINDWNSRFNVIDMGLIIDLCILFGTDFCSTDPDLSPELAFEYISKYGNIEELINVAKGNEKVNFTPPANNWNPEIARNVYNQLVNMSDEIPNELKENIMRAKRYFGIYFQYWPTTR